jgi:hypothetical protein
VYSQQSNGVRGDKATCTARTGMVFPTTIKKTVKTEVVERTDMCSLLILTILMVREGM